MVHPYQITRVCKPPQFDSSGILLAACGPKIVSVDLEQGSVLSQWPVESELSTVCILLTLMICDILRLLRGIKMKMKNRS